MIVRYFENIAKNLFVARIGGSLNTATEDDLKDWLRSFKIQYPNKEIEFWQVKATYDTATPLMHTIVIVLLLEIQTKPSHH